MYIVTGGAGFVGSNLIRQLNVLGIEDIWVVDNLKSSQKFHNLVGCHIKDYSDKEEFISRLQEKYFSLPTLKAIFHQGACTDTMEYDGKYMMQNNYSYSRALLDYALTKDIKFVYASSAAVYGSGTNFEEKYENEAPINVYGYSKYLFDQYVRSVVKNAKNTVAGLRYFNVYGPYESHKEKMSSVVYQFYRQLKDTKAIKLFQGTGGYADGEQKRDFVFVQDVARINTWFLEQDVIKGIFNVGTGVAQSFNEIARTLVALENYGEVSYIPFPKVLESKYQSFTQADISSLRRAGYSAPFVSLEDGIKHYHSMLCQASN
ncbi:MAG: ADP-glyceromanno-heptose 6-epimerase [Bacteroidetes bacterium]|nr:ADP-glyceromanno-heptose 6-epimerase [Bacteroidota bacterium]